MTPDQLTSQHISVLEFCHQSTHQFTGRMGSTAARLCEAGYLTAHSLKRELGGVEYSITAQGEAALQFRGRGRPKP